MRSNIENLLRLATRVSTAEAVLAAACAGYGRVVRTRVMLAGHERPRRITAIVEMEEKLAVTIALDQGAENLGTRLVVFQYEAPAGFQADDEPVSETSNDIVAV
jgi:hypothetical protein